jgi:hypothetical protein
MLPWKRCHPLTPRLTRRQFVRQASGVLLVPLTAALARAEPVIIIRRKVAAAGGGAPTFVTDTEAATWTTDGDVTASVSASALTVQTNDVLVAVGITADQTLNLTCASSPVLTWTPQQTVNVSAYTWVGLWTAIATSNTSLTVTVTRVADPNQPTFYGLNVLQFRGSSGVGASNQANNATGTPTVSVTTTLANSALVAACGDWSAVAGGGTWGTGPGTPSETAEYPGDTQRYGAYVAYYPNVGAIGAKSVTMTAPTGQKWSLAAVEIKGTP